MNIQTPLHPPSPSLPFGGILQDTDSLLPGADFAWLKAMRTAGFSRYAETGLPTAKREEWKYTRLAALENTAHRLSRADDAVRAMDVLPSVFDAVDGRTRLVFVNGHFRADLSSRSALPSGVICESLGETLVRNDQWLEQQLASVASQTKNPLVSLNTAAMQDGFVLHLSEGTVLDEALEIIFVNGLNQDSLNRDPIAFFPRNVVVMEANTQAQIIVHECGTHECGTDTGNCFVNMVNSIIVKQNARLDLTTFHEENARTTSFSATAVQQERDSLFNNFALSMGDGTSRHEQHVVLSGQGASCRLDGTYMMRGAGHCDHTTVIEHGVPETTSDEMFKGVLDDASRAVFQGKIIVHPDAWHTDGRMLNKTMLLSDRAEIDSKPELEIYADDVKCSHGVTSGQVDKAALFYLQSRGIPEPLARSLLVQSFLGEVIERITDDRVRAAVLAHTVNWLSKADAQ